MITWQKPSGAEIQTNSEKGTIEAAVRLGWVKVEPKKERLEKTVETLESVKTPKNKNKKQEK